MKHLVSIMLVAFLVFLFIVSISAEVFADGDEGLGTPSINIASGTGYIASGTGLEDAQPSALSINITDNFNQVLLYWSGNNVFPNPGDDTIIIDGTEVKGTLIGTSDTWPSGDYILVYRADITNLGLVRGGANNLQVSGLNFDNVNHGAGILVILDNGFSLSNIEIRDGEDYVYHGEPGRLNTIVPQTFTFDPVRYDRTANLSMFFSSVRGVFSGGGFRPTSIEVTVGKITALYSNLLDSSDGNEWDTVNLDIIIPARADSLTINAFSRDDLDTGWNPASFTWLSAALSVPVERGACRVTAGGNKKDGFCDADLQSCVVEGADTWGGQFGAPPRIDGNWTHHHQPTKDDSFVFHSNEMFKVICSDPGPFCEPARYAPNRQIDFMGLGRFNNKKGFYSSFPDGSLCFQVHLEDTGEPGPGSRKKDVTEPCMHCPGTPIINAVDCPNCTDYYMIKIYDTAANNGEFCTGNVIYVNGPGAPDNCEANDPQLGGYFTDRGNVQLHPDKNGPN